MQGIYGIENTITGDWYVGQSVSVFSRWGSHVSDLEKGTHVSSALQEAWITYGVQAFTFHVLEAVSADSDLNTREAYWIQKMSSVYNTSGTPRISERMKAVAAKRTKKSKPVASIRIEEFLPIIKADGFLEAMDKMEIIGLYWDDLRDAKCPCCGEPLIRVRTA